MSKIRTTKMYVKKAGKPGLKIIYLMNKHPIYSAKDDFLNHDDNKQTLIGWDSISECKVLNDKTILITYSHRRSN